MQLAVRTSAATDPVGRALVMPGNFATFSAATLRTPPTLLERMQMVVGSRSYAAIARVTDHNDETVRRYLTGGKVSVQFVTALAECYGVSADWLLLGRGRPDGRPY